MITFFPSTFLRIFGQNLSLLVQNVLGDLHSKKGYLLLEFKENIMILKC
jgi:hypothetical protein